jgi:undecaprenyl-phosphate 4-deoxy-4-formamido-L-arabinose transferase
MTDHQGAAPRPARLDLSIVVPVYRSEDCLEALVATIARELNPHGLRYEVILVNDGSPDQSWLVVESLCRSNPNVVGVDLRRNFGQDNAILTGLRLARGGAAVVMDDDLQHHPRDIPALLAKLNEGADVVYANFYQRRHALWKRAGSWFNGKVAEWVIDKPPGIYLSPFKIIRNDVVDLVCQYEGPDPYLDGLLFQVTARIDQVDVDHHPRFAGRSNYTFLRSLKVWARLATAFSIRPLRLVTWSGFLFAFLGGLLSLVVVVYRLWRPEEFEAAVAGWASLMVTHLVTTGLRMIFLGVLGEYAGRTYMTVSKKPQTAVRTVVRDGRGEDHRAGAVFSLVGSGWCGGGPTDEGEPDLSQPVGL